MLVRQRIDNDGSELLRRGTLETGWAPAAMVVVGGVVMGVVVVVGGGGGGGGGEVTGCTGGR